MEKLYIKATRITPEIDFDPQRNVLKITGTSCPEDVFRFSTPVFSWLDVYLPKLEGSCVVDVKIRYMTTGSSKCLVLLFEKLDESFIKGKDIIINWYYEQGSESLREIGEELKEDLKLFFNLIPSKEEF